MTEQESKMHLLAIELKAQDIFNKLRQNLFNSILIVCVKPDGKVECFNSNKTDTTKYDFSDIFTVAASLRATSQGKYLFNADPDIQKNYELAFAQSEYDNAIKMFVEQRDFNKEFEVFVSSNIIRTSEKEKSYLVLKLNKEVYNRVYKLPTDNISRLHLFSDLVDASVYEFFKEVSRAEDHDSDGYDVPSINSDLVIKTAGIHFMTTPTLKLRNRDAMFGLAEKLNAISFLEYEKHQISHGGIILTYRNNPIITYSIKFQEEVFLSNAKRIRKLLEMTTDRMKLVSDGSLVYGFGEITSGFNPQQGEVYEIIFNKQYSWTLLHDGKSVINYYMGNPALPRNIVLQKDFVNKFYQIFGKNNKNEERANRLYNIVYNIIEEHTGAILVISDKAKKESERLKGQSTLIEPMKLEPNNITSMIKIDGAVMADLDGTCFAIGVILDGLLLSDKGDSSRGSRYNSSIRYYYSQKKKAKLIVIIVSDDGDVDILPKLPPQISKKIIIDFVNKVKKNAEIVNNGQKVDTGVYNSTLATAWDLSIYFSKDECKVLNDSFSLLEKNCESKRTVKWNFQPLIPNPDYDEKLYFSKE